MTQIEFSQTEIATLKNMVEREKSLFIALDERRNDPAYLAYIKKCSVIEEKLSSALEES